MKRFFYRLFRFKKDPKNDNSSEFSRFFRNASSREKKKIFMDVARKASEDQRKMFQRTQ